MLGNGTLVLRPKNWHMGWKNQICGSSTVKCEKRTRRAHCHCSQAVGILFWWLSVFA
jgi:hypothetical protein